ncbi:DUF4079 domain-containing protein [Fischerella thermalis]|uniref:DUF4079 domain-containing protein n=1 Tax=Fischerella thermalis TaxID=372787 RepID=UPI0019FA2A73|nr:DUF4079 domain-containing protein [Fischerella thermalis]MBF2071591.1 DUF4079 domain-containing protein [Fischerella thermalis M48_A2018_028]
MDLPSFLWLWRIAAWSMGLSLVAYVLLALIGIRMLRARWQRESSWLRSLHYKIGICLVSLVLLLLLIGIVGTYGHFGSLGHSQHLWAGLTTVMLVLLSAGSATQIGVGHPWARHIHIGANIAIFFAFAWVSITGWSVVQKYLP